MLGRGEELLGLRQLHHAPDVHHRHAVADVPHDAQVVRHEEVGQPELGLQVLEQIQDLGLHRDVQGRDRLVGDHQAGLERERAGDADALALAAAEGMGEPPHVLGPEPDAAQEIGHALLALAPAPHAVDQQRLADEVEQRHAGIERGERVLEDHLHLAAQRPQLRPAQPAHLDHRRRPVTRMRISPAGRLDGPQDAARGGGLPAAALPDEAQRLPLVDVEVDAVHRADVAHRPLPEALPDRKELLEPGDPQQDVRRSGVAGALMGRGSSSRRAGPRPAAGSAPPRRSVPP